MVEEIISEYMVNQRISEMARDLSYEYRGRDLVLVGLFKGSVFFLTALAQKMTIPIIIDFMSVSSYTANCEYSGNVRINSDLTLPITGKDVVIVEDIIDTGRTLKTITEMLMGRDPAILEVATLLDKPQKREVDFTANYVGFQVADEIIVGWGLDYNQKYRELPYIGIYTPDN